MAVLFVAAERLLTSAEDVLRVCKAQEKYLNVCKRHVSIGIQDVNACILQLTHTER